jgi:hypothetical protein
MRQYLRPGDHKAILGGFNNFDGDDIGVVDPKDAFDLGQKSCEESQIAAGHTNESRNEFRRKCGTW